MFDIFEKEKSDFLIKKDKSKKGYVDKGIKEIVDEINSKKDYYTTSSCAGRIVLLEMKSNKKNDCNWIFSKHNKIKLNEIIKSLKNNKINNEIWFKQQPVILHVACRNLDAAKKLLDVSRKIFRRAGIIGVTNRKVMIEIIGDERLETIIADKDFAADESYVKNLVKYANKNFEENKKKSKRFLKIIKKEL
ncbi:MAG: tRNA wybutosine-synthesizing 3 family protein [Nanoarchaeota archaeon]